MSPNEVECTVKKIFKEDFIGRAEACAVFGKVPATCESSIAIDEISLGRAKEDGFYCFAVPKRVKVHEIIARAKIFIFKLGPKDAVALMREEISTGFYLIKKEPRRLTSGGMLMREFGIEAEKRPRVVELMYFFALCNLLKKRILITDLCTTCRDEVICRGEKTRICISGDISALNIEAWRGHIETPNILPVKKLL